MANAWGHYGTSCPGTSQSVCLRFWKSSGLAVRRRTKSLSGSALKALLKGA